MIHYFLYLLLVSFGFHLKKNNKFLKSQFFPNAMMFKQVKTIAKNILTSSHWKLLPSQETKRNQNCILDFLFIFWIGLVIIWVKIHRKKILPKNNWKFLPSLETKRNQNYFFVQNNQFVFVFLIGLYLITNFYLFFWLDWSFNKLKYTELILNPTTENFTLSLETVRNQNYFFVLNN